MNRVLNIFKNKVILALMISFMAVVGTIVYLVVDTYINKDVYAIDFSSLSENEIITWYSEAFGNIDNLWWLAALCGGAFTSGIVYLIYICNEYIEKKINFYENNVIKTEDNIEGYDNASIDNKILLVDDITIK